VAAILRNHDCRTLQIGGATDHIRKIYQSRKSSMR
jgi:hypothetical protein